MHVGRTVQYETSVTGPQANDSCSSSGSPWVCRLVKDKMMYTNEATLQEEKVEKIKAEAGCEYVIRKQVGTATRGPMEANHFQG